MNKTKCFYCTKEATHFDIVQTDTEYLIADVCNNHLVVGLSS
jgi:hypothetical protein